MLDKIQGHPGRLLAVMLLATCALAAVASHFYAESCESSGGVVRWGFTSQGYAFYCDNTP